MVNLLLPFLTTMHFMSMYIHSTFVSSVPFLVSIGFSSIVTLAGFWKVQSPGAMVAFMKSRYMNTLVQAPGAFFMAQPTPQLTMPTSRTIPFSSSVTKGPPESPQKNIIDFNARLITYFRNFIFRQSYQSTKNRLRYFHFHVFNFACLALLSKKNE